MKILVCGSRDFSDEQLVHDTLDIYLSLYESLTIIHGACRGADTFAAHWAKAHYQIQRPYPAQWTRYGKRAGYVRNQLMLDREHPDLVLAFFTDDNAPSRGTKMMCMLAKKAHIPVQCMSHNTTANISV